MKLINVLSPEAFQDCHIQGSINVPYDQLEAFVKDLPKQTELIVYCASYSCPLSKKAFHLLKNLGFTNIAAYEGGIVEWHALGYPSEGSCSMDYLNEQHTKPSVDEGSEIITAEELQERLSL